MRVTQVAIRPTEASSAAGRPALTPELLAATGARYSRSNEGLDAIVERIDPANLDKSVESIFRMIDYGHQSIADMVPVAMFIDGISIWLAYYIWSVCPTANGQESSTRYIKLSLEGLLRAEELGINHDISDEWYRLMTRAFDTYSQALTLWEQIASANPTLTRIPTSLLNDTSDAAVKQVARMQRNYVFDRARYYLPVAAKTNIMLLMSARNWIQLCQVLLSHPLAEARQLGTALRQELTLCAPRMLKHAEPKQSIVSGLEAEFLALQAQSTAEQSANLADCSVASEREPKASLRILYPDTNNHVAYDSALQFHDNRYAWVGNDLRRTAVRFGWEAVAFAEIRDLNRHRTGNKHCPLIPNGFYHAVDQLPSAESDQQHWNTTMTSLGETGRDASRFAKEKLVAGEPTYIYWTLLGTQYPFEHLATADKFIYEAELRTGIGAHFRYAKHLRDVLALWYQQHPETQGLILEGSAEPE